MREDKEELYYELVDLSKDYMILNCCFRLKNTENGLEVFELFPEDCYHLHGVVDCDELIFEFFFECDNELNKYFNNDGFYECDFLFSILTDSDGFSTWSWLEVVYVKQRHFTPISIKLEQEFEWSNIITASFFETNQLPF